MSIPQIQIDLQRPPAERWDALHPSLDAGRQLLAQYATDLGGIAQFHYGWSTKMIWALEPGFTHKVTVRGGSLRDGRPIQVSVGPVGVPALTVVLDPRHPPLPIQHGRWTEFPFAPVFHRSGCYLLEARWPRGSWRVSFAAGR